MKFVFLKVLFFLVLLIPLSAAHASSCSVQQDLPHFPWYEAFSTDTSEASGWDVTLRHPGDLSVSVALAARPDTFLPAMDEKMFDRHMINKMKRLASEAVSRGFELASYESRTQNKFGTTVVSTSKKRGVTVAQSIFRYSNNCELVAQITYPTKYAGTSFVKSLQKMPGSFVDQLISQAHKFGLKPEKKVPSGLAQIMMFFGSFALIALVTAWQHKKYKWYDEVYLNLYQKGALTITASITGIYTAVNVGNIIIQRSSIENIEIFLLSVFITLYSFTWFASSERHQARILHSMLLPGMAVSTVYLVCGWFWDVYSGGVLIAGLSLTYFLSITFLKYQKEHQKLVSRFAPE